MILQALKEYYDRKAADPQSQMAPLGFEWKEIPYVVVLNARSNPVSLNSTYEGVGRLRRARRYLVPQAIKKTSGIASNLFWENPEYALGVAIKSTPGRVIELHQAFKQRINNLGEVNDLGVITVKRFLEHADKTRLLQSFSETWAQLLKSGGNVSFQLEGETILVAESPAVKSAIQLANTDDTGTKQRCLVTGGEELIELLHPAIKGVWGAQSSGANIVSFNLDAFKSFGRIKGGNAPVGKTTVFAYTTALNHLLDKDSKQRIQAGDASTVFWSEKTTQIEQQFDDFFREPPKDDPDRNVRAVESLFKSVKTGTFPVDEQSTKFYVLGLAPNASRIAVRFWFVDTVQGISVKICQHFEDLRIIHGPKERDVLSLFRLLVSTATQGKSENIPPNLTGETMRAMLEGLPYPQTLLQAVIRRIRAEQSKKDKVSGKQLPNVSYPRAALIKACINRSTRYKNPERKEELKMSLDESNTNVGYRLGRLFAALERIQIRKFTQNGGKEPNSTIRDKYYGSASGTPAAVFGTLIRLSKHHLSGLENVGERINFEKLLGEVMCAINDFPPHLTLENQGRFAIGYYHQMHDFYTKKEKQSK